MANTRRLSLLYSCLFAALVLNCHGQERKAYVVYMGDHPDGDEPVVLTYNAMLQSVLESPLSAEEFLIYSYGSFNGFAARLTDEEVARFLDMEGVVSVLPNIMLQLHTTRSWDFIGKTQNHAGEPLEGDVIIGMLDTGIWPESPSFSDEGFGPPPKKWNGTCQTANNFTCNNKIIGARFYNSHNLYNVTDIKSPRDSIGHGTHTASTAAGREVPGVSYYGLAEGVARGGVPGARIAVYKVCWTLGCSLADVLAAFDDAIADGVDIISASLGFNGTLKYFEDPIAIGSFHAMRKGILTSNSAGNSGPLPMTTSNNSPWSLTVAASSIDRKFVTQVVLGNGQAFTGLAINSFKLNGTSFPLLYGGDAANVSAGFNAKMSRLCPLGSINSLKAYGKIILCDKVSIGSVSAIQMAKGLGVIMADSSLTDVAINFPLPATVISTEDGAKMLDYIRSYKNPIATILVAETWKDIMAPIVSSFSSRGPNRITPDILKPDLTAPGVNILAAWSPIASPSFAGDTRSVQYEVISGTSMSCPHVSGAAAYVKAAHPNWSPAAIKSALMTTAYVMDPTKHEDAEFAYGSGQLNPRKAVDPGLVFDASEADYIDFLCKQGYNTSTLRLVTGDDSACNSTKPGRGWGLNYPSLSLAVEDGQRAIAIFPRTVTNVGSANSTYTATMYINGPFDVVIEPTMLSFSAIGEKKSFTVKVSGPRISQQSIISGAILWKDGIHEVRMPLIVYTILPSVSYWDSQSQLIGSNLEE